MKMPVLETTALAILHDSFGQSCQVNRAQLSNLGTDNSPVERSEMKLCYELLHEALTIEQIHRKIPLDSASTFQYAVLVWL